MLCAGRPAAAMRRALINAALSTGAGTSNQQFQECHSAEKFEMDLNLRFAVATILAQQNSRRQRCAARIRPAQAVGPSLISLNNSRQIYKAAENPADCLPCFAERLSTFKSVNSQ
jgi:hypothetical protein